MRNYFIPIAAVLCLAPLITQAAGDAAAGMKKSQTCAACHGPDGNSTNSVWPKLAGQHAEYLLKQLQDFKSGKRENAQMSPMATNLGDQDMQDLAAFYSSQKIKPGAADPALVTLGQKIYRAGNIEAGVPACMACHGPAGHGNPAAVYPATGGQHAAYSLVQLKAFREGLRTNDPQEIMRTIVGRMTDDEIKAVSEFMQGLHATPE
ncbi:MAG: c-type cytochrome [Gammaproteobacteria bacterium]